jgi:hypothetical protein
LTACLLKKPWVLWELAREIHQRYVVWLEEVGTPKEHLTGWRDLR